jgi:3-polyprenyl-4-hydroxybenzoate decarboxylase and related decarboxylases
MGHTTFRAALVIGVDPMLAYTSPIQVPDDTNDFEVAAAARRAGRAGARQARRARRAGAGRDRHRVRGRPHEGVMEGPLGEYTGYYGRAGPIPVARVLAITHRNDACFQGLLTGVRQPRITS